MLINRKNLSPLSAPMLCGVVCFAFAGCRQAAPPSTTQTKNQPTPQRTPPKPQPTKAGTSAAPKAKDAPKKAATPSKTKGPKPVGRTAAAPMLPEKAAALAPKPSLQSFPQDMPIYPTAKLVGVGKSDKGAVAGFDSNEAPQKIAAFYQKQLPAQGWTVKSARISKQGGVLNGAKNQRQCEVKLGQNPKTKVTSFSLTVIEK